MESIKDQPLKFELISQSASELPVQSNSSRPDGNPIISSASEEEKTSRNLLCDS